MKKKIEIFFTVFLLAFIISPILSGQTSNDNKGKSFYTTEEIKQMCGVPVDQNEMKEVLFKQDEMYKKYISDNSQNKLSKTETTPNWRTMMSAVENQGTCGNCWAHAATGIVEGQLHIYLGSEIETDLDEMDIVNNSGHTGGCNEGDFPTTALSYIQSSKAISEIGTYPNLQGVRWDINSYSIISGITTIKNALQSGPVASCFIVYDDFGTFFNNPNNRTAVYHYDGNSGVDGGHAIVIVGYDDVNQYWLCKNSWGSDWADGGYFRIGYGQCGIETWENTIVTVNQSCLAKIAPNLINSLSTAINYGFANNEWAYNYTGSNSLSSNTTPIPTNSKLIVKSGSSVNLNGYGLFLNGGVVTIESGAAINGLAAYVKSGSTIKGYCGSVNVACNGASTNDLVDIQSGTFNENVSFTGKNYITIAGKGNSLTNINGTITVYSSSGVYINNLTCKSLVSNSSSSTVVYGNVLRNDMTTGTMALMAYNSSGYCAGNYTGAFFGYMAAGSNYNVYLYNYSTNTSISDNRYGVYAGSNSNVLLYRNYPTASLALCGNTYYDLAAVSGAAVTATYCSYSGGVAKVYQSGGTVTVNSQYSCSGLSKSGDDGSLIVESTGGIDDPGKKDFEQINQEYAALTERMYGEGAAEKGIDKEKYRGDYNKVINGFKGFMNAYPASSYSKVALTTAAHCLKQLDSYDSLEVLLQDVKGKKEFSGMTPLAKRLMIDCYVHQNNFDKALSTADDVLAEEKNDTTLICDLLYAKSLIYAHNLNKTDKAVVCLSSIINNYKDNPLSYIAANELQSLGFEQKKGESETVVNNTTEFAVNNYPNPFNPVTTIKYSLFVPGDVSLIVYDYLGREIRTLVNEYKEKGEFTVQFDASSLASGIYFYKLQAGKNVAVKKMLLLK